jgi:flagellin
MVDADLEEASARLTALQTQQELAIEALSIANSSPESILALFQ